MIMKTIPLDPPYEAAGVNGGGLAPTLTCYVHDTHEDNPHKARGAVIICPGGGYTRCSKREGEPVAMRWYSYGFNAYLLDYSCTMIPFPTALTELAEAMSYVRMNSYDHNTDPHKVAVCGFSAGAHLACSLGVYHDADFLKEAFGGESVRPDAMVLSYPVITAGEYAHRGSADNITPSGKGEEFNDVISLEKHVTDTTPRTFIWHCADDNVVPVENSLMFTSALSAKKVPFELHIFPKGGHGIALCDDTTIKCGDRRYLNPTAAQWFELALDWLRREFDIEYK